LAFTSPLEPAPDTIVPAPAMPNSNPYPKVYVDLLIMVDVIGLMLVCVLLKI